ncbi:hypothetical protein MW290_12005 [Aquincola tertiaricarbonis]|uniref:Uncharacterized protein n=1 Tax=Aquincola tertiaricarbonis TaxID=391953 RepID=A0ABY4S5M7_AQUTE|nr:hypothetical protein [Aquincola tertiaricarbonis]URI06620.1 hypothetical protein MW290_12005 [Aquincola tertiaricarbonis]
MSTYWQFRLVDGVFTGAAFGFDPEPDAERIDRERHFGCGLWRGEVDPQRQRVDVAGTGELVDWQRPAPAATPWVTWSWDEATRDYLPVKTLLALQLERAQEVEQLLASLDLRVPRLAGEITEAIALGQPIPTESRDRLVALNELKAELRAARQAMLATDSAEALQAVVVPSIPASW